MIPQVDHKTAEQIIMRSYETKVPTYLWGTFGIGKSYLFKQVCKKIAAQKGMEYSDNAKDINDESKFVCLVIPMHQYDQSEIKGIPTPNEDRTATKFLPTSLLPQKGQGMILLDELNLAPPLVQANGYQLVLDRQIGEYRLPDGYVVAAAGNTAEDRAHVFEMANPLKNRFVHAKLTVPSAERWAKDFALKNNLDHRIISFLSYRQEMIYKYNPDLDDEVLAIATPRTWEFASRMISGIHNEDMVELYVGMAVSQPVGAEFIGWLRLANKYDIPKIFESGKVDIPDEASEAYSLISAIVSHYVENTKEAKKKEKEALFNTYIKLAKQFPAEYALIMFCSVSADIVEALKTNPAQVKDLAVKYMKFLRGDDE